MLPNSWLVPPIIRRILQAEDWALSDHKEVKCVRVRYSFAKEVSNGILVILFHLVKITLSTLRLRVSSLGHRIDMHTKSVKESMLSPKRHPTASSHLLPNLLTTLKCSQI